MKEKVCFKCNTRKQEKFYKTTQNLYERLLNGSGNSYHSNVIMQQQENVYVNVHSLK